jgi:hypothetical protein
MGGINMVPVKKLTKQYDWREMLFSSPDSEPRQWVEYVEPESDEEIHPEIADLLGCFCLQTGAQFG